MLKARIAARRDALKRLRNAGVDAWDRAGVVEVQAPAHHARHLSHVARCEVCPIEPFRVPNKAASELAESLADKHIAKALASVPLAQKEQAEEILNTLRAGVVQTFQAVIDAVLARRRARQATPVKVEEVKTPGQRLKANAEALNTAALYEPGDVIPNDKRAAMLRYTGYAAGPSSWYTADKSTASIKLAPKIEAELPVGLADQFDHLTLLNEYYTPARVCEDIVARLRPHMEQLKGADGRIRALEPSAGIGRFVEPTAGLPIDWSLVELSGISQYMLERLFPDAQKFFTHFQEAVSRNEETWRNSFDLILTNPPYSEPGAYQLDDKHETAKLFDKNAYRYFLARLSTLLAKDGIMVAIVPWGLLTGTGETSRRLRDYMLRRLHFLDGFALPSRAFVGSQILTCIAFFQGRGGVIQGELPTADQFILDGKWFERHPEKILGKYSYDPARKRERHKVEGEYEGLPPLTFRPACHQCVVTPHVELEVASPPKKAPKRKRRAASAQSDGELAFSAWVVSAVVLGDRVLTLKRRWAARTDAERAHAAASAVELDGDVRDWLAIEPTANDIQSLQSLAKMGLVGAVEALDMHRDGEVPREVGMALGATTTLKSNETAVALLGQLYRRNGHATLRELRQVASRAGMSQVELVDVLGPYAIDLRSASDSWPDAPLLPMADYASGEGLWDKYDGVEEALAGKVAADVRVMLQAQLTRLLEAIEPVDDLHEVDPRDLWVPPEVVEAWYKDRHFRWTWRFVPPGGYQWAPSIMRATHEGVTGWFARSAVGKPTDPFRSGTKALLSWLNSTNKLSPYKPKAADMDMQVLRIEIGKMLFDDFQAWYRTSATDEMKRRTVERYNRTNRGWSPVKYESSMPFLARWTGPITLYPHQAAGANRLFIQQGGLLAFDVGVGKTYTLAGAVVRYRQAGTRRPMIIVPTGLILKWRRDFDRVAPDYRVCMIGVEDTESRGVLKTVRDTGEQRAAKLKDFADGLYDVCLVTLSMFGKTRIKAPERWITEVIRKSVFADADAAVDAELMEDSEKEKPKTNRELAKQIEKLKKKLTEMVQKAEEDGDPGIRFDEIGVDLLCSDEAHDYKNMYGPAGSVYAGAEYLGDPGTGSSRAWAFDMRATLVRQNGGAICLLTATPAKNSPLELFNLLQLINPDWFESRGISRPENFLRSFVTLNTKLSLTPEGGGRTRPFVSGFKNLKLLRRLVLQYADFKLAEHVNLPVPDPKEQVFDYQRSDEQAVIIKAWRDYIHAVKNEEPDSANANAAALVSLGKQQLAALHPHLATVPKYTGDEIPSWVREQMSPEPKPRQSKTGRKLPPKPIVTYAYVKARPEQYDWRLSPKIAGCVAEVNKIAQCGHIIFCESIGAHAIVRQALIDNGLPEERIRVVNSEVTKNQADKEKVIREFNGDEDAGIQPKCDVIIANKTAEQGMDLQVRTCAIHHLDLPWEPSTLQQRNGRGVRQGNKWAPQHGNIVHVNYYITAQSADLYRLKAVKGKSHWLDEAMYGGEDVIANPGASQTDMQILIASAENPEEIEAAIQETLRQAAEAELYELRQAAMAKWQNLQGAKQRLASMPEHRVADGLRRVELAREQMAQVEPRAWPYRDKIDDPRVFTAPSRWQLPIVAVGDMVKVNPVYNETLTGYVDREDFANQYGDLNARLVVESIKPLLVRKAGTIDPANLYQYATEWAKYDKAQRNAFKLVKDDPVYVEAPGPDVLPSAEEVAHLVRARIATLVAYSAEFWAKMPWDYEIQKKAIRGLQSRFTGIAPLLVGEGELAVLDDGELWLRRESQGATEDELAQRFGRARVSKWSYPNILESRLFRPTWDDLVEFSERIPEWLDSDRWGKLQLNKIIRTWWNPTHRFGTAIDVARIEEMGGAGGLPSRPVRVE